MEKKIKVKILHVVEGYYDQDSYGPLHTPSEQSNWDEVTQAELEVLRKWAAAQNIKFPRSGYFVMVTEVKIDTKKTIQEYLGKAEEELAEIEEKARKKKEAESLRIQKKQSKKEAKEREKLAELQRKYPE